MTFTLNLNIYRRQELEVDRLQEQVFSGVFDNIVEFVSETCSRSQASTRDTIPTAVLLTGVNMPDHNKVGVSQFYPVVSDWSVVTDFAFLIGQYLKLFHFLKKVFDQLISKLGSVSSHVSVIGSGKEMGMGFPGLITYDFTMMYKQYLSGNSYGLNGLTLSLPDPITISSQALVQI